jgi:hypothetical protein
VKGISGRCGWCRNAYPTAASYALKIQAKSWRKKDRLGASWKKEYNDEDAPSLHYQTLQTYQDEHFVYMLLELVQ